MTVSLVDVTVRHQEQPWLEDVTLDLADGAVAHVLSPAGGGKSTLLRVVAGLERPTTGRVVGVPRHGALLIDAAARPPSGAHGDAPLHRWLAAAARSAQGRAAPTLGEVASTFRLGTHLDEPVARLPPAVATAAILAAAILAAPPILLLDEPAAALPLHEQLALRAALRRLLAARDGVTLVSARQAEEMTGLDGEVVILADGRLVQRGRYAEIAARPRSVRAAAVCHVPRLNLIAVLRRDGMVLLGPQLALAAIGPLEALPEGRWTLALPADRATLAPFDGAMALPAVVDMVETDGGVRRLKVRIGRASWRLVLPTSRRPSPGEALAVHVDPEDFVIFGDTGLLERMPGDIRAIAA